VDQQAREAAERTRADAGPPAPTVLERAHAHALGQREERPLAAPQHADDLDLALAAGQRAGEGERRADRPAEAPGVGEQEADRPGLRLAAPAAADRKGQPAEHGAVERDGDRPEQPPAAGLAPQDAGAGCGR
jgi:hypothetical protein